MPGERKKRKDKRLKLGSEVTIVKGIGKNSKSGDEGCTG